MEFLVETKKVYTIILIKTLTPLIYEGLMSIYQRAKKISNNERVLKIFQGFLKEIPRWSKHILTNETNRILAHNKCSEWLLNLIKATVKANLIIMSYSPFGSQPNIDKTYYQDIELENFIHVIYIECAREIWNNPYLFYHNYSPIDLKRNQRDIITLIGDGLRETIRKQLPIKQLLDIYLNDEMFSNKKVINPESAKFQEKVKSELEDNFSFPVDKFLPEKEKEKTTNDKILSILNNSNLPITQTLKSENINDQKSLKMLEHKPFKPKQVEQIKESVEKESPLSQTSLSETSNNSIDNRKLSETSNDSIDNRKLSTTSTSSNDVSDSLNIKIKQILDNELKESNGKSVESVENGKNGKNNDDYADIYSNSITEQVQKKRTPTDLKQNFFSKYLKF